ncbi:hypothetical protein [Leifsonia virtsii]|uniref:Signal transduction histidine kinase n=1 Tax=Leifsonia virtsii TaxID=3035915 RepID=A0ABT8IZZ8_9MICO|nr:hypothetical protein [Leifsonia virtsii]MDN4598282.1 hypothetical protein [Leifsonia virtsii]
MSALTPRTIVDARSVPLERTPQRLDPLGAQSAWLLVPLLGGLAVVYAAYSTFLHRDQLRDPAVAGVAIAVLAVAVLVASVRSHPGFAPFGRWSHFCVIAVAVTAACLFDSAVWGHNERIQDDWGQIAVALLLVVMPFYRPVGEVAGSAVVSALVLGGLAAAQHSLVIANDPLVYATVAATPVLALAAGGAGYAWTITGETLRWREVARDGQERLDGELRQAAARMIAQERMTALNAEAVPFLTGLLQRGQVTEDDVEDARNIADRLRGLSVQAVGKTWLADTLDLALGARLGGPPARQEAPRVDDPDRLERVLTTDQRAIVGALLSTVAGLPGLDPGRLTVSATDPERPTFLLRARVEEPRGEVRRALLPFVSALNSVAMDATMRQSGAELTIRFASPGAGLPYPGARRR